MSIGTHHLLTQTNHLLIGLKTNGTDNLILSLTEPDRQIVTKGLL
jgi:hypothetical protein